MGGEGRARTGDSRGPDPYVDPYVAGVGVGLVLLAAFVVMGRGLGASGAFGATATEMAFRLAPRHAAASSIYGGFAAVGGGHPLRNWLVFEIVGVLVGGALSAYLAGRFRLSLDRGPRASRAGRAGAALVGGMLMGFGAALARGCTSGQALTGGALLSVGAWLFIVAAFVAGYGVAPLFRRLWT
jgi:uncharacterized membrane protein YedE/YeeE